MPHSHASRPATTAPAPVDPAALDTGTLSLFVGQAATELVRKRLADLGFGDLRQSHGYVFQHLVDGERTVGDLADRLGMTQQGASKAVAELERFGYLRRHPDPADARVRRVGFTERGRAALDAAHRARRELEEQLADRLGAERLAAHRAVLAELLTHLGGAEAVRRRHVRPPG